MKLEIREDVALTESVARSPQYCELVAVLSRSLLIWKDFAQFSPP